MVEVEVNRGTVAEAPGSIHLSPEPYGIYASSSRVALSHGLLGEEAFQDRSPCRPLPRIG